MVAAAERNRAEDQRLREAVDARNTLDSIAYQVERTLTELGDAAPVHEKARAEMLISDAREALRSEAPLERVRELTDELTQVHAGLSAAPRTAQPSGSSGSSGGSDDDVIDADFDRV
jgi:molecular chaperone DnaK